MIRVIDESGSAEAATSPSHGSGHSRQESSLNAASDTTRGPRAASRAIDYQAAYNSLEEMICKTRARIAVLGLIADGFMERDVGVDHVRLPSGDVDCLLFMIEEARSVVSALDERYRSIEGAEMVAYVEEHARIKQANAMRLEDNEAVAELIVSHRKAERELSDALAQAERKGPDRGDIKSERIRVAMEAEKSARRRLLAWRPRTVGASADRLNYLLCDRDGPWSSTMPEGADLHEFARSMLEPV